MLGRYGPSAGSGPPGRRGSIAPDVDRGFRRKPAGDDRGLSRCARGSAGPGFGFSGAGNSGDRSDSWVAVAQARGPLGVPRAALFSDVARRQGAVQADRPRYRVGCAAAAAPDADLRAAARTRRRPLEGGAVRHPLLGVRLLGPRPLDTVRGRHHRRSGRARHECEPRHEGLLPAAGPSDRVGRIVPRRHVAVARRSASA